MRGEHLYNIGKSAKLGGKYIIKFARGDTWYSSKEMFGSDTDYFQPEGTYDFKSGYYWELTLDEGTEYLPGIDADDF